MPALAFLEVTLVPGFLRTAMVPAAAGLFFEILPTMAGLFFETFPTMVTGFLCGAMHRCLKRPSVCALPK